MTVTVKLLTTIIFCLVVDAKVQNHTCVPSSFRGVCVLEYIFYHPSNTTSHIFPTGYPLIRVHNNWWMRGARSVISHFDAKLYNQLGQPAAVEMISVYMNSLEIPHSLQQANFAENAIDRFTIEAGTGEPSLSSLDLSSNHISDLANISSLTNLEFLYLAANQITTIDKRILEPLIKLKYLNLNNNKLVQLSLGAIPQSLIFLWLYYNEISVISYDSPTTLHFLEVFNIEGNELKTLDGSALIQAMPRLRIVSFGDNKLDRNSVSEAIDILKRYNVSFSPVNEGDSVNCDNHIERVCLNEQLMENSWLKAALLSLLTVATGSAFVWIVWRVFLAMNK
ncbi:internalin A-like [Wyeomyia smithii]|uniref:internalin A-like n=1 Tax=Wyeomyia smithii TaxID=174621 RepID=UPI002467E8EB|nr:internalin A-like [Wyeomyia smithii]